MSKRVKSPSVSLGPSVGDDPDEVYLATLVQECKARGLRATKGAYYQYKDTFHIVSCCAEGARMLACDTEDATDVVCSVPPREGLIGGNDLADSLDVPYGPDGERAYLAGFTIGMCFQDAMSDEGIEP